MEIQAGTFALLDAAFSKHGLPFHQALWIESGEPDQAAPDAQGRTR